MTSPVSCFKKVAKLSDVVWATPDYIGEKTNTGVSLIQEDGVTALIFRSTNFKDWKDTASDLEVEFMRWHGYEVHAGFVESIEDVWPFIHDRLKTIQPSSLLIGGLSKGASLSFLANLMIFFSGLRIKTTVCALEPARAFSWSSAKAYDLLFKSSTYWTKNEQDIVTHLPPVCMGYAHVGQRVQLGNPWAFWNAFGGPSWSHLLPNVKKNLDLL